MDLIQSIVLGQLVAAAEAVPPNDLTNRSGTKVNSSYDTVNIDYKVITSFYGNDLATDTNPARGNDIVSFGLILQAPNNDVVIAIRGTDGIWEWVDDAEFLSVKCPFLAGAGNTEDGFTAIYNSLRITTDPASTRLAAGLANLPFNKPIGAVTICGHSLGGALATLLALDTVANTAFKPVTVYTYASPRVGNPSFADTYNQVVPNTFRIANRMDLVPKLPLPPFYEHVNTLYEILPAGKVKLEVVCEHHLTTYLFLLSSLAGKGVLPLDGGCAPA
jgi:hypothetical protein